jgi:predicted MFS family arabinose efflux permease
MTANAALANLALTGMDALIVVFLVRTAGLSAATAGLVMAAFGVGGVLGAIVARPLGRRFGTARAMLIAAIGPLSSLPLLALTHTGPDLTFAVIANMLIAGGVVTSNVIGASFRQAYVPPYLLGRVSSATMTVSYAMMPAGALLAGVIATALGIRTTMWIITGMIAASGLIYLPTPLRRQRDLPRRPHPSAFTG